MQGKVKWFNPVKGWGFITGIDGKDYFAHQSSIQKMVGWRCLVENEPVTFDVIEDSLHPEKSKAVDIIRLEPGFVTNTYAPVMAQGIVLPPVVQ